MDFAENGGDQAQEGGLVGEDGGDASPALDFSVETLDGVAGAQAALVSSRQGKDGEAIGDVSFHPVGELRVGFGIDSDKFCGLGTSRIGVVRVENAPDVGGDFRAYGGTGDIGVDVLLEVELAALPRHTREDRGAYGGQAGMGVGDDELRDGEAVGLEGGKEVVPVRLGLGQGGADTEGGTLAVGTDPDGAEHRAIEDAPRLADFPVARVEDQEGKSPGLALTPSPQARVE